MSKFRKVWRFLLTNKVVGFVGDVVTGLTLNKVDDAMWRARKALVQGDTEAFEKELSATLDEGKKVVEHKAEKLKQKLERKAKQKLFFRLLSNK